MMLIGIFNLFTLYKFKFHTLYTIIIDIPCGYGIFSASECY